MNTNTNDKPINADAYRDYLERQITIWVENKRLGLIPPPLPLPRFMQAEAARG